MQLNINNGDDVDTLNIVFQEPDKKSDWEEAFTQCKEKLGETFSGVKHLHMVLLSFQLRKYINMVCLARCHQMLLQQNKTRQVLRQISSA